MQKTKKLKIFFTRKFVCGTIIACLAFASLSCFGIYLFKKFRGIPQLPPPKNDGSIDIDTDDEYFGLPRDAHISLNPAFSYENFWLGDGEENAHAIFSADVYYIFGGTTSKTKDFERDSSKRAVFMSRVDFNGKILSMTLLDGNGDFDFVCAVQITGGFAILVTDSENKGDYTVFKIGYDGTLLAELNLGTGKTERGLDLYYNRTLSRIAIIGEATDELTGRRELVAHIADDDLKPIGSTKRITRVASLSYVGIIYRSSNYNVFATATEGFSSFPTVAAFNENSSSTPSFSDALIPEVTVYDVMPYGGGYCFAVIDHGDGNKAKLISYNFATQTQQVLFGGAADCSSLAVIMADYKFYLRAETTSDNGTIFVTASFDMAVNCLENYVTRISGAKKLLAVVGSINSYALLLSGTSTEIIGLDDSVSLKTSGEPMLLDVSGGQIFALTVSNSALRLHLGDTVIG